MTVVTHPRFVHIIHCYHHLLTIAVVLDNVKFNLLFIVRKRLCLLRLGCLPIKMQTDRYIKPRIQLNEHYCCPTECITFSKRQVEDKINFLCICEQYDNLRNQLYRNCIKKKNRLLLMFLISV